MIPAFRPGSAALPSTRVELSVSAKKLMNLDLVSKSDPMCVLFAMFGSEWREVDRTEIITDNQNPVWSKKFILDYRFEEKQMYKFAVYDIDSSSSRLEEHDFLGHIVCSLGEIASAQSKGFSREFSTNNSVLLIHFEEQVESNEVVSFRLTGKGLDKKDFFGKSDPYYEIFRSTEGGKFVLVHRSEVIQNTLNPSWVQLTLPAGDLCMADHHRILKFSIWDWDRNADPDYIGSFSTTVDKLKNGELSHDCINEDKKKKKGAKYKNSGVIQFNKFLVEARPSFLEYITHGTQLNFTLAVDFTGSNGNPVDPSSLHFRDPSGHPNQYVSSIQAVGEIIQDYDSDHQFPALGFGARIPPHGQVSHEFFLNMTPDNPFCVGLEGILQAYYTALSQVQLYGPTNFSPVINHVAKFASAYQGDPSNYFVLLIITDGIITDMEDTKKAIISASSLPMSIIIVGVGDADFCAMDDLDADGKLLRSGGLVAKRDIVQFVEMRRFLSGGQWGGNRGWDKEQLAKSVLAEVPKQLTDYMTSKNFTPGPPQ